MHSYIVAFLSEEHAEQTLKFQVLTPVVKEELWRSFTAAAAASMSNSGLLSRRSSLAYFSISVAAILLLLLRGIPFPNPNAGVAPWYETPAFIVGIPAFPWLLTFMLGVVLLRKSEHGSGQEA